MTVLNQIRILFHFTFIPSSRRNSIAILLTVDRTQHSHTKTQYHTNIDTCPRAHNGLSCAIPNWWNICIWTMMNTLPPRMQRTVCTTQNQISWIRRRDWHILSSGAQMYTNDERFAILHTPGSNTWTLQIKFVQRRDHGMYECQVRYWMHKCYAYSVDTTYTAAMQLHTNTRTHTYCYT